MAASVAAELPISSLCGRTNNENRIGLLYNGIVLHAIIGHNSTPTVTSETASEIQKWLDLTERIKDLKRTASVTQFRGWWSSKMQWKRWHRGSVFARGSRLMEIPWSPWLEFSSQIVKWKILAPVNRWRKQLSSSYFHEEILVWWTSNMFNCIK